MNTPTNSEALPPTTGSEELEMAKRLTKWRDRILAKAANNIEGHFIDGPVDDFSDEEEGFERGLRTAVDEICKLMDDPSYFGRLPQNASVDLPPKKGVDSTRDVTGG